MRKRTGKTVLIAAAICLISAVSGQVKAVEILAPTRIEEDMPEPLTDKAAGEVQEEEHENIETNGKIALIYTGDVHGQVSSEDTDNAVGYDGAAALKQELCEQGYDVLMFDAGGSAQGTALVNESRGAAAIEFMNAAEYDLMVPGNHELAWGPDVLMDNVLMATFPVIAANIIDKECEDDLLDPYAVFEMESGVKIGVFGLITPQTVVRTGSKEISSLYFMSGKELYDCAQEQIDALKKEECDLIICVGHLGEDESFAPDRSYDVIENTEGIDLFIDGHGHEAFQSKEQDTLLVSSGAYFENAGLVIWDPYTGTLETELIAAEGYNGSDKEVAALIAEKQKLFNEELSSVNGESLVKLDGENVRLSETNLGDLAADALLWKAEETAEEEVDAALIASGEISASIDAGDLSTGTWLEVFPEENYMVLLKLKGWMLQDILETACQNLPDESDSFVQVSGLIFEVIVQKEGNKVEILYVGNRAFDPEAIYFTAMDERTASGVFLSQLYEDGYITGVRLSDALGGFVTEYLEGIVDETYRASAERIIVR